MKMNAVGAIALTLGAGTLLSALDSTQSSAAQRQHRGGPTMGTPSGTPRATPVPGVTRAPRPTPVPGDRDIRLLEGALARTLTEAEGAAIAAAATTRDTAVAAAITSFETEVAALFDLTVAGLQSRINSCRPGPNSDLAAVLAQALGRALTAEETVALNGLLATRDAAVTAATDAYRTSVAAAVGLSVADLDARIAAYVTANAGGGRGSGGGRGRGR